MHYVQTVKTAIGEVKRVAPCGHLTAASPPLSPQNSWIPVSVPLSMEGQSPSEQPLPHAKLYARILGKGVTIMLSK